MSFTGLVALQVARASLAQSQDTGSSSCLDLYNRTLEVLPIPRPGTFLEKVAVVSIVQVLPSSPCPALSIELTSFQQLLYRHYVAYARPNMNYKELVPLAIVIAQIYESGLCFMNQNKGSKDSDQILFGTHASILTYQF